MNRSLLVLSFLLAVLSACSPPAGACTANNCLGCCDSAGQCQPGNTDLACGLGPTCGTCSLGTSCQASACLSTSTGGGSGGGAGGGAVGGGAGGGAVGGGTGGGATGGGTGGAGGGQTGTFTVSGRVSYDFVPATYNVAQDTGTLDFARTAQRPVQNGVVRVVQGTTVLATTNSAADGAYALTFTANGSGPLSVQALAKTSTPPITVQDNTSSDAVWAIGAAVPTGGGTVDLHATHGWTGARYNPATRTAAPFAILASMYTAASAFLAARPTLPFALLKVNWSPLNTTDSNGTIAQGFIGTSYFDSAENQIYVVGKDGVDTDEYDNHVIVHEWAHFFEANVSRSDSVGGDHTAGDLLDPRDAFSEGWGDAASGMLTNDPIYADTYFTGNTIDAFGWDLENQPVPTDDPSPGAFSETSVMRLLYDAWDPANDDALALGLGPIADAFTTGHKTTTAFTTIGSLIASLKAVSGVSPSGVDTLAASYGIGSITTGFGDGHAPLRSMYQDVASFPRNQSVTLDGREPFNFASQNKYWVVTGNGARLTVTGDSAEDVSVGAYQAGREVGYADDTTSGPESFSFNSTAGMIYVINLEGYGALNGTYPATIAITSP